MELQKFETQFREFIQLSKEDGRFEPLMAPSIPILDEDTAQTAIHFDWTYLMHCAWAARVLARTRPEYHFDFGSYVYFAAIASAFVEKFTFSDLRPLGLQINRLFCRSDDLTAIPLNDNSLKSVSCMHVIEHIGLGRYGDKLDAQGDIKAAKELVRVLAPGGRLLIVQPMNEKPRLNFNAHRVYSFKQVMDLFEGLGVEEYCFLHDDKVTQGGFGFPPGEYTGCFVFMKPKAMSA